MVAPVRERGLKSQSGSPVIVKRKVAPVRERGLKYAVPRLKNLKSRVAPVRERGLKWIKLMTGLFVVWSLP